MMGRPPALRLRNVNKLFPLTIDEEWRVFDNLRRTGTDDTVDGSMAEAPWPCGFWTGAMEDWWSR